MKRKAKMKEVIMRYSDAFKRQVVEELESGKLKNQNEAREYYGISGGSTVGSWLRKYGKPHLLRRIVTVQTPEERNQIKALKQEIKKLEKALSYTAAEAAINKAYFEVTCEKFGVTDFEGFKKKADTQLFSGQKKSPE